MAIDPLQEAAQRPVSEFPDTEELAQSPEAGQPELTPEAEGEPVSLDAIMQMTNVADSIDDSTLTDMGTTLSEQIRIDQESRADWEEKYEDYMRLATQVMETKSMPWHGASNIKYPLLTIAVMQFAARAYHQLVPGPKVVKARVVGKDPDGAKSAQANRISKFMSWQCLEDMDTWEDDMDRLCLVLPIAGNTFKKTYHNSEGKNVSELVLPKDLIVNYYAKDVASAPRKSHVLYYYPNDIVEKIRTGEFIEFDMDADKPDRVESYQNSNIGYDDTHGSAYYPDATDEALGLNPPGQQDEDAPHTFYECHCWWDLDEDGYKEPYIITIHEETEKVVRVVARYSPNNIITNDEGNIAKIIADEYFTNFIFVPDPNSGVYGLGFGTLLGPINETANTLINQLVDAGTLANLPSGFLARGIRIPGGQQPLKPGEWRHVNTIADDLRKGIVPLPVKEPSNVLYELLAMMLDAGQQLSSVTSLMVGENPGQNQPYSTTSEVLRQGLQVFSSIYKRIHRSMKKEFKKLYKLNELFLTEPQYFTVLDYDSVTDEGNQMQIFPSDFNESEMNVVPASDPSLVDSTEERAKAESLKQMLGSGFVNPQEATNRILEAEGHADIEKLMDIPEPEPSFEQKIEMEKVEIEKQKTASDAQIDQYKAQVESARAQAQNALDYAKAMAETNKQQMEQMKQEHEQTMMMMKEQFEALSSQAKLAQEEGKVQSQAEQNELKRQEGEDRINQKRAEGELKLQQQASEGNNKDNA